MVAFYRLMETENGRDITADHNFRVWLEELPVGAFIFEVSEGRFFYRDQDGRAIECDPPGAHIGCRLVDKTRL